MIRYRYDPIEDLTFIVEGNFTEVWKGRVPHSIIHEHYNQLVFEIIKEPEIAALPQPESC